jgi:hypothetical protein
VAAALAAGAGVKPREVPVGRLQAALAQQGVLVRARVTV